MIQILLVIMLIISSYFDIKSRDVYLINNIIIFILAIFNVNDDLINHILGLVIPVILLLVYLINNTLIGLGDIEFLFASSFYLGYSYTIYQIFIASFLGLLFIILTKRKEIPFIPFLSIGFILSLLLSTYF